jgi:hypothetical protein
MLRKSILVISDQHAPYHHIDTLDFLKAIKLKYKPDCVVNIGDEMGIRALTRILLVYRFHHKRFTVEDIIERWAPPSEN